MLIHVLLIDFLAVADPAGNWAMDGCHMLWSMFISVYEKLQEGAHGLYGGIILESNVAARALRMHGSVLFERTCVRVGLITNTAREGSRSNWTMDGGGVLWSMSTCW